MINRCKHRWQDDETLGSMLVLTHDHGPLIDYPVEDPLRSGQLHFGRNYTCKTCKRRFQPRIGVRSILLPPLVIK